MNATHAPTTRSSHRYGSPSQPAGHGWRTPVIGLAALAVIATGFGVTAYLRTTTDTVTTPTVATRVEIPASTYAQQVPQVTRVEIPASTYAQQVPFAARVVVPHGALQ